MSQTLNTAATALLAERDGIHPAHAANRLALAIRVVESAERVAAHNPTTGRENFSADWPTTVTEALTSTAFRYVLESNLGRPVSESTLRLALLIAEAGQ